MTADTISDPLLDSQPRAATGADTLSSADPPPSSQNFDTLEQTRSTEAERDLGRIDSLTSPKPPRPPSAEEFFRNPKYATSNTQQRLAALDRWASYASDWVATQNQNYDPTMRAKQSHRIRQMRRMILEEKPWQEAATEVARDVGVSMAASGLSMTAAATAGTNVMLGETGDLTDLTELVGEQTVKILDRLSERRETTDQAEVADLVNQGFTKKEKLVGGGFGASATSVGAVDRREKLDNALMNLKVGLDFGQYPRDPEAFTRWLKDANASILREAAIYNGEIPEQYTDSPTRRFDGDLEMQSLLSVYSKTRNDAVFADITRRMTQSTTREVSDEDTQRIISESTGVVAEIRDKGTTLDGPLAGPLQSLLGAEGVSEATLEAVADPVEMASTIVSGVLAGGTAKAVGSLAGAGKMGKATQIGANVISDVAIEAGTEAFQAYVQDSRGDILEAAKQGGLVGLAFQLTGAAFGGAKRAVGAAFPEQATPPATTEQPPPNYEPPVVNPEPPVGETQPGLSPTDETQTSPEESSELGAQPMAAEETPISQTPPRRADFSSEDFTKSPNTLEFEFDDNAPEETRKIAEKHGIELRRPKDHRPEVVQFETDTGSSVRWFEGRLNNDAEGQLTVGFVDPDQPGVVFVNRESPVPTGWVLGHEVGHIADRDSSSGFEQLKSDVLGMIPAEKLDELKARIEERESYAPDQFDTELVTYLMGDALSGHFHFGLDLIPNNEQITTRIKDYYAGLQPLNPTSLVDSGDDTLLAMNAQDLTELGMMAPGMAALNNPPQTTAQQQAPQQSPSSIRGQRVVNPDPITGQGTKPTSQILFDAAKSIGANVQYKGQSRRSLGTYYPGSAKVAVRYEGDLDTTAHEIAHALDDRLGIVAKWATKRTKSPFDAELKPFAAVTSPKSATLAYRRAEGVAEWIRAWLVNPDEATKVAPKFAAHFEKTVPEKTRKDLRAFGDDIRRFAGAKGAEQILANVRWRPDSAAQRLKSFIVGDKAHGFQVTFGDKLAKHITDSLRPFEHGMEFAKEVTGEKPLPSRDPMVLARLYAGVNGKAETVFEDGMIDTEGNRVTGGGVTWLLEPFDTTTQETLEADTMDAVALMIAQRTLEKSEQLERDDNVSGIGGGIFDDTEVAKRTIDELEQNPERFARLQEGARRYRAWARANLQYLVDSGRLSQEEFQKIIDANEEYVAMARLREIEPGIEASEASFGRGGVRLGSVNNPLHKFRGGSRTIENPYSILLYSTHQVLREGDRNNVMAAVADLLSDSRGMYQGDPKDLAAIGSKTNSADPQKIAIWRDGKKEYWRFDKDIHDALKGLTESVQFPGWVTALPRLLRFGVTRMPAFAARNVIRDVQNRLTVTRSGTRRAVRDTFRLRGNMDPTLLKLYGGDQFGYYAKDRVDYMRAMDAAVSELVDDPKTILIHPKRMGAAIKRLGRGYDNLLQKGEYYNRMAEFHSAFDHAKKELGYSDYDASLYAAAQARDLIDFAVAGVTMRYFNQLVPFANPAVQGLRRTIKAAKENPAAFGIRWVLYAAIPSIMTRAISEALGYDDEYDQLPAYQRDLFWNFKVADDLWVRIPKNFEMGVLGAFPDRLYGKMKGDENAFTGYTGSVIRSLAPVDETSFAGPWKGVIGAIANYDFFRQDNTVPPFESGLDLDLRKSDSASRIGKAFQSLMEASGMGDTKFGRLTGDARVVDYLFREHLGIFGDTLVRASNSGRKDTNQKLGLRDTGLTTRTPAWAARDVQAAFNIAERRGVSTRSKSFSDLNYFLEKYFDSKTRKDRQKWAEEIQKEGTRLRSLLEEALENGDI